MIINYTNSRYKRNDEDDELLKAVERVSGSTYKGVTSNTPSISKTSLSGLYKASSVGNPQLKTTALPKASATTVGPKAWDKTATVTALPKANPTTNNSSRLVSALERASKASDLTPTARQMTRSNNFLKGVGTSLAATVPTLIDTTKQSLSDWQDKVKREGMASALSEMARNMDNPNWTYGNPVSTDSTGYRLYQKANDYFQKAQSGLNPAQQQAMGIAASIAQNAVTLPTAIINPAAPLVIMGAGAAANRANELTSQGKTATEALGRGLLSGALEAATEKIPLENLLSIAKTGGKSAVRNVLQQMGTEGAEELASYIMNYAADVSAGDENANFSTQEALQNFLGGAISGGVMGGAASAVGNAPSYRQIQADNISYNNVLPRGNANYSSDISNADINIVRRNADGTTNVLPVSQYMDEYSKPEIDTNVSEPTTEITKDVNDIKKATQQANLQPRQFVAVEGTRLLRKNGLTDGNFNYYNKNGKWITVNTKNGIQVNKPVKSLNTAVREANKTNIKSNNKKTGNAQQIVSDVLPTSINATTRETLPISTTSNTVEQATPITREVLPTETAINNIQPETPKAVTQISENNIDINQPIRQSLPMAKGNGTSSVSGTIYPTKAQRTIDTLNSRVKELKYQQRFKQAENDLASKMAIGRAKAETARRYQNKIDNLNEKLVKKGEDIKQLSFDKKELQYQQRFNEAQSNLAAQMAVGRAKAESQRINAERLQNKALAKEQTKVTSDILKIAKKLKNAKLSNDEKIRLNNVLSELDTFGKTLSAKQAYNGLLARDYIEQMQAENPDYVPDPEIQALADRLNKTRVSDLTPYEAEDYLNALKAIRQDVRNRNKMLATEHSREIKAAADEALNSVNMTSQRNDNFFTRVYNVESLNMSTLLDKLDNFTNGAFTDVKDALIKGQRKKTLYEKQSQDMFADLLNNPENAKEINTWNSRKTKWIDTGLKFSDGTPVEISPMYRVDIYMHSRNRANKAALLDGGYVFPRRENLLKGKDINRNSEAIRLTQSDIDRIVGGMTETEKRFAGLLAQYYDGKSKSSINEVSNILLGYDAADVDNYYPATRSRDFLYNEYSGEGQSSIIHPGFLKERTGNTSVPIQGANALDVLLKSINDTANYYGMAIPLRDLKSMLNSTGNGNVRLEKAIADKYGKSVTAYINKWITEVNGSKQQQYFLDNISGKLLKNYAGAVLNFNPKVAIEQPSALITSAPAVGYHNIMKALVPNRKLSRKVINQINQRSGYRWDRGVRGNSRGELSALSNNGDFKYIGQSVLSRAVRKINPTNWIKEMDLLTTDKVAIAAYYKVKDDMKISPDTPGFWDKVTAEYDNALEKTQSMYNIMQRTGLARSGSTVTRALNMFSTERNKQYNMVYDALGKYKAARNGDRAEAKAAAKNFRDTVSSIAISSIWGTALDVAVGLIRRRKDYEDEEGNISLSKVGKDFALSYLSNITGNVFLGSQAYSLLANMFLDEYMYDVTEPTLDMVNDFMGDISSTSKALQEYLGGAIDAKEQNVLPQYLSNEKTQLIKTARKLAQTIGKMTGIPIQNAERTILNTIGLVSPETKAEFEKLYTELDNSYLNQSPYNTKGINTENALRERISNDLDDNTLKAVSDLYQGTKDSGVLPRYSAPTNIKRSKTEDRAAINHNLTMSEKYSYIETYSGVLSDELPNLINSSYYRNASTEEKEDAIKDLYNYADEIAENSVLGLDDKILPFIPEISGLSDERQEAARELNRDYGLTYDEFADLYEKYSEIDDEDIKPNMKQTRFDEYLYSLGYTDEYAITPVLKDEFSYFNVSPAKSYYDNKGYQLVDGILPVDTYADLSGLVNGLKSGVDYPKGERSPFAKSLIDAYLEKYGYNPTANERAKIYDAMGVAKSYWY